MDTEFDELIERTRAGDADAAEEIVRRFEWAVRVAVRARLFDPGMRRQFDSMDICQSVLASFFIRVAAGQYDLQRPAQLVGLLTKMAQNKLAWHVRHNRRQRRDVRRTETSMSYVVQLPSTTLDPARQVEARELLEKTLETMDLELQRIVTRRLDGESWQQIADGMGGTAGGRRKQFERGLEKITQPFGIGDGGESETD